MESSTEAVTETRDDSQSTNSAGISHLWLKVIYITIGCVGILGNGLVLLVFSRSKMLRSKLTNKLIINQTVIDFFSSLFLLLTSVFDEKSGEFNNLADTLYCVVWLTRAIPWSLFTSSTYGLLAITIERYCGVVHPIWHRNHFTSFIAVAMIVFVWVIGPLTNITYEVPTSGVINQKCYLFIFWPSTDVQQAVGILTVILQWLIPIIIHAYCYSRMAYRLHTGLVVPPDVGGAGQPVPTSSHKDKKNKAAHRNVIKTLFIVTLCFAGCWTLNEIYWLLFNLGYPANFGSVVYHISVILVNANCCVNPVIYMCKYKQFQVAMRRLFRRGQVAPETSTSFSMAQSRTI